MNKKEKGSKKGSKKEKGSKYAWMFDAKKKDELTPLQRVFFIWMFMSFMFIILFLVTTVINIGYPEFLLMEKEFSWSMFNFESLIVELCIVGFAFGLSLIIIERLARILI
jgi:hypothetical protein